MQTSSNKSTFPSSSLTVIVPALNEEHALGATLEKLLLTLPKYWSDWEILIFNDGSTDRTGEIAEEYAASHPSITAIHHKEPVSLGEVFKRGLKRAGKEYVILIHGQNAIGLEALNSLCSTRGYDLVIPYQANTHERPFHRQLFSRLFVALLNFSFGLKLRYYNHYVLYRRACIQNFQFRGLGYAFQAELLIKLLLFKNCSYKEIAVIDDFSSKKKSHAFRPRNIYYVLKFYLITLFDIYKPRSL